MNGLEEVAKDPVPYVVVAEAGAAFKGCASVLKTSSRTNVSSATDQQKWKTVILQSSRLI